MWITERKENKDRQMLTDYLLGRLSEPEQQALAERYFADDDLFDRLLEVENDLLDQYVRGQLAGAKQADFERYLNKLPDGRRKVAVARSLMKLIPERRAAAEVVMDNGEERRGSRWQSFVALILMPPPSLRYGLVAVVLVAGAVWLFTQSRQLKRENEQLRLQIAQRDAEEHRREQTLAQQMAEQRTHAEQLRRELEQERLQADAQAREIARLQAPEIPVIAMFLTPASRDTSVPDPLSLKEDAKYVTLTIPIRNDERYTGRPAILQTTGGEQVQSLRGRQTGSAKLGKAVVFRLDAGKLTETTYKLTPTLTADDGLEIAPDYYFTVVRR